jgi:hypothetical protein
MPQQPSEQDDWVRVWPSKDGGVWYALTAAEFKVFPLEQLARHWAEGKRVAA